MFSIEGTVERENLCNQQQEIKDIKKAIKAKKRVSLYAPRKHGKTSIAKNIIIPEFAKEKPSLPIYIDLYKVEDLDSAAKRIKSELRKSLEEYMSQSEIMKQKFVSLVATIGLTVSIDPVTALPTLSFNTTSQKQSVDIYQVIKLLRDLEKNHNLLLVFDEFQDIYYVKELSAILRTEIQHMKCPMLFLGSRMALLSNIFNEPTSPFYDFIHEEIKWKQITSSAWLRYFNKHLKERGSSITLKAIEKLLEISQGVPKTIIEVGDHLYRTYKNKNFEEGSIPVAFEDIASKRIQGLRHVFSKFSKNEISLLKGLSKFDYFNEGLTSAAFIEATGLAASTAKDVATNLLRLGYIEEIPDKGLRVSNPLFRWMLLRYDI